MVIGHAPDDDDDYDDDIPCSLLSTPKCEKVQMCKKGFREGNGYQILAQLLIIRFVGERNEEEIGKSKAKSEAENPAVNEPVNPDPLLE